VEGSGAEVGVAGGAAAGAGGGSPGAVELDGEPLDGGASGGSCAFARAVARRVTMASPREERLSAFTANGRGECRPVLRQSSDYVSNNELRSACWPSVHAASLRRWREVGACASCAQRTCDRKANMPRDGRSSSSHAGGSSKADRGARAARRPISEGVHGASPREPGARPDVGTRRKGRAWRFVPGHVAQTCAIKAPLRRYLVVDTPIKALVYRN
jgi:hypothetical protein